MNVICIRVVFVHCKLYWHYVQKLGAILENEVSGFVFPIRIPWFEKWQDLMLQIFSNRTHSKQEKNLDCVPPKLKLAKNVKWKENNFQKPKIENWLWKPRSCKFKGITKMSIDKVCTNISFMFTRNYFLEIWYPKKLHNPPDIII